MESPQCETLLPALDQAESSDSTCLLDRGGSHLKAALRSTAVLAALALPALAQAQNTQTLFTRNDSPAESYVIGGPWTLEQSGAAVGLKSAGYCDKNGNQVPNPAIQRMEPYYFPFITGTGDDLQ